MNVDDLFLILHHHWVWDTSWFPEPRQSLQLAFLILICAYTASRPGALVHAKGNANVVRECALAGYMVGNTLSTDSDSARDEDIQQNSKHNTADRSNIEGDESQIPTEVVHTLCYKHVTLTLLPNPGGERDLLAMELDLQFTKGWRQNHKQKVYCLYKVDDLIFNPVIKGA
ncbi:hypothetical protein EV356DRAFT_538004 [Viridothelium virens]|uniref:Uncharacterized protein n=1 Tax=Viridothelium virens TaxID=1048519 RepID=A0A6A6GS78_VIRVR|nr:hypothetical protein EV356DRAFT_538004 [Viridothelium virens]